MIAVVVSAQDSRFLTVELDGWMDAPVADPPSTLSKEGAAVWRALAPQADQAASHGHILEQYCRHVVAAERIAALISLAESYADLDIDELDRLYKMQERQTSQIIAIRRLIK